MTDFDLVRKMQVGLATEALAAVTAQLQKEGYPARTILAAITGLAVCEMAAILGPEEAARELREAADICQRAAERGEVVGPLAGAEVVGRA